MGNSKTKPAVDNSDSTPPIDDKDLGSTPEFCRWRNTDFRREVEALIRDEKHPPKLHVVVMGTQESGVNAMVNQILNDGGNSSGVIVENEAPATGVIDIAERKFPKSPEFFPFTGVTVSAAFLTPEFKWNTFRDKLTKTKDKALLVVVLVYDLYSLESLQQVQGFVNTIWRANHANLLKKKRSEFETNKGWYPFEIIGLVGNTSQSEGKEPLATNEIDSFCSKKLFGVSFMRNFMERETSPEILKRLLQRFYEYLNQCWERENAQLQEPSSATASND